MEIKPHGKLITKQWYILLTISLLLAVIGLLLQFLLPLIKGVASSQVSLILWPITLGLIAAMWIISAPIIVLWIKNLAYIIEEDRITIHKGILTKVQQNIPYRAITDFMLHRSLYDRFLGIGALRIQTAGQAQTVTGYEGQLAGLVEWDELLQQLRARIKKLHPVAEATAVAEPAPPTSTEPQLQLILEELRSIRNILEAAIRQRD
ncbi:MAG: PH domain-containing protein [Candidatus Neomarinimicrobiota bacterium]